MNIKFISHRRNTIKELISTPIEYGVEIDLRSNGKELVIHHEPFVGGEKFEEWIKQYRHGTLILNVKEEGLESAILDLLRLYKVIDYFFLDQSFPFLIKWAKMGLHQCAVRVSEYESIETALNLSGLVDWVWVDCFSRFPLMAPEINKLRASGFKICLVSPELHGRIAEVEIPKLALLLQQNAIYPDRICTKECRLWKTYLNYPNDS